MYFPVYKLTRLLFWMAIAAGILGLLFPEYVPWELALGLASACGASFLYLILHVRWTRRTDWRCPLCSWVPFALYAWKCKNCQGIWDSFSTEGLCPRCNHQHAETACIRCRKISPNRKWRVA